MTLGLALPTPGNKYVVHIPQFTPDSGSISDRLIPRSRYGCGTSPATDSCIGLCLATSADGLKWEKKPLDVVPGTNIVIDAVLKVRFLFRKM